MKTKRLLALVLALVLALGLALPAFAEANWDDFYIVTQPPENLFIPRGEGFTLNVEVNIPEGVKRVTYQWRCIDRTGHRDLEGATEATLRLNSGDPNYPNSTNSRDFPGSAYYIMYYCIVTGYDDAGSSKIRSSISSDVAVEGSFGRKLYSLTLEPFVYAFFYGIDAYIVGLVFYPVFLVQRFIDNFKVVFLGVHPSRPWS